MEAFFFGIIIGIATAGSGMPPFIGNASPYTAYSSASNIVVIDDEDDQASDEVDACTSGVTPAQQAELQRLSTLLTKHGESLDNLATNKHIPVLLKVYRERLISMIDGSNYRCGTSYDDYVQALVMYVELIKVAKQQTPSPLTQPRDDLLAGQHHLTSLSKAFDVTKALSSTAKLEGMIKYDQNSYDNKQPNQFHLDGSIALDTILNAPAKSLGLTTSLSFTNMTTETPTSWTGNANTDEEWTKVIGTPVRTDTKGSVKAHLMMIDHILYGSVDTFDIQTSNTGSQAQLTRIKETFAPYSNGTYAKVDVEKAITDIIWKSLSQTGSSDILTTTPLIDFYHTDGNTSYGVVSSEFCHAMGKYAVAQMASRGYGDDTTDSAIQEFVNGCLTQQAYALLLTNNKGYITLTREGDTTYLGTSSAHLTKGQKDILRIRDNIKTIGWDNARITHLHFPFFSDSDAEGSPVLTYTYPNLSISATDPDNSNNTIRITGTVTETALDLSGKMTMQNNTSSSDVINGTASLTATYDNDTYTTHLKVDGTRDHKERKEKTSLSIDVKATETLSTTNVPSITAPTKTQDVTLFIKPWLQRRRFNGNRFD